jgi:hypothetical protein
LIDNDLASVKKLQQKLDVKKLKFRNGGNVETKPFFKPKMKKGVRIPEPIKFKNKSKVWFFDSVHPEKGWRKGFIRRSWISKFKYKGKPNNIRYYQVSEKETQLKDGFYGTHGIPYHNITERVNDKMPETPPTKPTTWPTYQKGGNTDQWIQEATQEMEEDGTVGSFTNQARRAGMSTVQFAKDVLSNPEKYSLRTRRRAQFMKNVNPQKFKKGGVAPGRKRLFENKDVALELNTVSNKYSIVDPRTGKFMMKGGVIPSNFKKAAETEDFVYYVDEEEGDENANTIMIRKSDGSVASDNYFANEAYFEDILENNFTWENPELKETHEEVRKEADSYAEGGEITQEKALAKEIATLIGSGLGPESFYEYLQDYSKDEPDGEYGFDEDELETLGKAFSEVKQESLGMTNLNTSKVKSSKLYKAYIKESVNEGGAVTNKSYNFKHGGNVDSWAVGRKVRYKSLKTGRYRKGEIVKDLSNGKWELENGAIVYEKDPDVYLCSNIKTMAKGGNVYTKHTGKSFNYRGQHTIKKVEGNTLETYEGKFFSIPILENLGVEFTGDDAKVTGKRLYGEARKRYQRKLEDATSQLEMWEDEVFTIKNALADAHNERTDTNMDMEAEAGQIQESGEQLNDDFGNRYGAMLNQIDERIENKNKELKTAKSKRDKAQELVDRYEEMLYR